MMSTDERNFRSAYYEKVGFRSVEEKKSLEILLKDKPLDRAKLKQFCLRFSVPSGHRKQLWKLLLNVVPVYTDCHEFVMDQRREEYNGLNRVLHVTEMINSSTEKTYQFYAMWLLQSNKMYAQTKIQVDTNFIPITQVIISMYDDDTEAYWVSKSFYDIVVKFEKDVPKLVEIAWAQLEKENVKLYNHMCNIRMFDFFPIETWFSYCFAGVLNQAALLRIWDKICGGSYKILVYLFVVLLTHQEVKVLKAENVSEVIACVTRVSEDTADLIASKSIEMWQLHGSPLTVHDKPKS